MIETPPHDPGFSSTPKLGGNPGELGVSREKPGEGATGSQTPTQMSHKLLQLLQLRDHLINSFVGRERQVTAILAGLLSGEPTLLISKYSPGTAKTKMVETLAKLTDTRYFYYLLTKFTEPDELLGPLSIPSLREGRYERIVEGRLPTADIAFIDEIFKGGSAVRNILLDIILNRRYLNGTAYRRLSLLALYAASNEVSTDVEDVAFYDRLLIRDFHRYVEESLWQELIDRGIDLEINGQSLEPIITKQEILQLQAQTLHRLADLRGDQGLRQKYIQALGELKSRGLELSDRRKVKTLKVAAAISIIYLEDTPSLDSLADALRFTAPFDEDDVKKVEEVIAKVGLSRFQQHIQKIQTLDAELKNAVSAAEEGSVDALKTLSAVMRKTRVELKNMPRNPRLLSYVRQLQETYAEAKRLLDRKREELFGGEDE